MGIRMSRPLIQQNMFAGFDEPTKKEKKDLERQRMRGLEVPEGRIETLQEAAGRMRTVLADPPWKYDNGTAPEGGVDFQYETMSVDEMALLPVPQLAHPDGCFFWIWLTWPMVRDRNAHDLLAAWKLKWIGEVVWTKPGIGVGWWLRPATEILCLSKLGKPTLMETTGLRAEFPCDFPSRFSREFSAERGGRHSAKPDYSFDFITRLSPPPRLELFSRKPRPGWLRWGNEA